jgi:hypothetical protein
MRRIADGWSRPIVATKQKRANETHTGKTAEPPSIERIEAAAQAARKLAEIAEEWADSLLNVYRAAPHLAGADDLIDRIEAAYRAIRPNWDETAIQRKLVETLSVISTERKTGALKDDQAVAIVRKQLTHLLSADTSKGVGIANSPTDATIRAAVRAWGTEAKPGPAMSNKWPTLLALLRECGLAPTVTTEALRRRHSRDP